MMMDKQTDKSSLITFLCSTWVQMGMGFGPALGHIKELKIGIWCSPAKHSAIRSRRKDSGQLEIRIMCSGRVRCLVQTFTLWTSTLKKSCIFNYPSILQNQNFFYRILVIHVEGGGNCLEAEYKPQKSNIKI